VKKAEVDAGERAGVPTDMAAKLKVCTENPIRVDDVMESSMHVGYCRVSAVSWHGCGIVNFAVTPSH
jgi:hypothetical protein